MAKAWLLLGTIFSGLAVMIGAFGTHALRDRLSERQLQVFQTGSHYQFLHAFALILLGLWCLSHENPLANTAGWLFTVGIILFSGSLYALAITDIKILGAITPFGGLCFIVAWACFAASVWKALP